MWRSADMAGSPTANTTCANSPGTIAMHSPMANTTQVPTRRWAAGRRRRKRQPRARPSRPPPPAAARPAPGAGNGRSWQHGPAAADRNRGPAPRLRRPAGRCARRGRDRPAGACDPAAASRAGAAALRQGCNSPAPAPACGHRRGRGWWRCRRAGVARLVRAGTRTLAWTI